MRLQPEIFSCDLTLAGRSTAKTSKHKLEKQTTYLQFFSADGNEVCVRGEEISNGLLHITREWRIGFHQIWEAC
jgi:hypothetical protein